MYSQALNAIILIGNLKVVLTAVGWTSIVICITLWLYQGFVDFEQFNDFGEKWGRKISVSLAILFTLVWIGCITVHSLPSMQEEIVVAKQVAPILDNYVEKSPESIYNPDVLLKATDDTIKGIVSSAIELPKYIQRLASGQLITVQKSPETMTREELLKRVKELEGK